MRELCIKVTAVGRGDATQRITRLLRAVDGVTAVEVDPVSGWVITRGNSLQEDDLLTTVRAAGFGIERVSHDSPFMT